MLLLYYKIYQGVKWKIERMILKIFFKCKVIYKTVKFIIEKDDREVGNVILQIEAKKKLPWQKKQPSVSLKKEVNKAVSFNVCLVQKQNRPNRLR